MSAITIFTLLKLNFSIVVISSFSLVLLSLHGIRKRLREKVKELATPIHDELNKLKKEMHVRKTLIIRLKKDAYITEQKAESLLDKMHEVEGKIDGIFNEIETNNWIKSNKIGKIKEEISNIDKKLRKTL